MKADVPPTVMLQAALAYAAQGWPVFPCKPQDKKPLTFHGFKDATKDIVQITAWWTRWPNAMIGVPMGAASGVFCVDLDRKPNEPDGVATFAKLESEHDKVPETRMQVTPSTGRHLLFKWCKNIRGYKLKEFAPGIETRGEGNYIIVAPSVMADGKGYTSNDAVIVDAPDWLLKLIAACAFREEVDQDCADAARQQQQRTEPPPDIEAIKAALDAVPSDDYDVWFKVAGALRRELGESGWSLFEAWSRKSKKFNAKQCRRKWEDAKDIRQVTAGTIFHYADQADPTWRERYEQRRNEDYPGSPADGGHQARLFEEWDAGDDTELPPPRGWLLGNVFARQYLSSLFGDGAVGKTSLRYAQLLSLATGRSLTGEHVFQRCRVLIISLEDSRDELRRRIKALCLHYNIAPEQLKGWLILWAPGANAGRLLEMDRHGGLIRGTLQEKIEALITKYNLDVVAIDPFVKSHAVEENTNTAIDKVAQILIDLSIKYDIAIDVPHHISKGQPEPGNADRGRGASALKDAGRLVYTLTTMSSEEAAKFGIKEEDRRQYIRMDHGKVNLVPQRAIKWFRLIGVNLGNATALYPHGDTIQVVEPWEPPDTWKDFSNELMERILTEIDAGLQDGTRYTDAHNARERAAYRVVQKHFTDKSEQQAREIIRTWIDNGILQKRKYENPQTRKSADGLWLNPTRKPPPPKDDEFPF